MSGQPVAAVFDLDGTLVRSEHRHRVVWAAWLERRGVAVDDSLLDRMVGRRGRDCLPDLARDFPAAFPGTFPEATEDLLADIWRFEATLDLPPFEPVPGAQELVRGLHQSGVPLALVTSAHRSYTEDRLSDLGLVEALGVVVTADDVSAGKPDPEGYLAAAAALGVAPGRVVAFEDSPAGVLAVKRAGMLCVAITTTQAAAALAAADRVVDDLRNVRWPPLRAA